MPLQGSQEETTPSTSESDNFPYEEYFDRAKSHVPTVEEICSISNGTSITEVISLIGKPHDFGPLSGPISLSWEADDGTKYYCVAFIASDAPQELPFIEQLMGYSTVTEFNSLPIK